MAKRDPLNAVVTVGILGAVGYVVYVNWGTIKEKLNSVKLTHTKDDAVLTVASGSGDYVSPDGTKATDSAINAGAPVSAPSLQSLGVPSSLPGLSDIFAVPMRSLAPRTA